jgi:hypothetical protein
MTYRDFEIPKKNGFRKISAPSKKLLRFQQSLLPKLNKYVGMYAVKYGVDDVIHGFRYNHNCASAAHKHKGFNTTLMMDISNFFNSITREHFKPFKFAKIPDECFHAEGYTAQGFATSPVLANLAIIPALAEIKLHLSETFDSFSFTIYADDFQISTNETNSVFLLETIADKIEEILRNYNLEINRNKTRIAFAKYGYRRILGINVGSDHIRSTRKIKRKIRAAKHANNGQSLGGLRNWAANRLPRKYKK